MSRSRISMHSSKFVFFYSYVRSMTSVICLSVLKMRRIVVGRHLLLHMDWVIWLTSECPNSSEQT